MDTLDELAEDFIIDGKDTQPNTVNQNIAYSTGEEHGGSFDHIAKLVILFCTVLCSICNHVWKKNCTLAGSIDVLMDNVYW